MPGSTAAFLDRDSVYPHYFDDLLVDEEKIKKECPASERGLIAATLYTMPQDNTVLDNLNDLTSMSASLDSLGWKKVFVDIRKELPSLTMLKSGGVICPLSQLKSSSSEVKSCDLDRVISSSSSYHISLPFGHNAICAFSRGKVSTAVNIGGRPIMDSLAIDLTNEISLWNGTIHCL